MNNLLMPCSNTLSLPGVADLLVEVMLDRTPRKSKPPTSNVAEWKKINRAVATNRERISLPELAQVLTNGGAFTPGVFREGRRSNNTWIQQQVFGLDFDHDYQLEEFYDVSKAHAITPAFVYPTFRHTEAEHRFRAVFVTDTVITDIRLRNLTQGILFYLFSKKGGSKGPDKSCKDAARIFLGTNKPIINENYTSTINPIQLLDVFLKHKKISDPFHYADWVKRLASDFDITLRGNRDFGVIGIEYISNRVCKSGENTCGAYIYNTQHSNSPEFSIIKWNDIFYQINWKTENHYHSIHPNVQKARNEHNQEKFKPGEQLRVNDKNTLMTR